MTSFLEALLERARRAHRRLVLSEGDDPRVRDAARAIAESRMAAVTVLGGASTAAWARLEAPGIAVRSPIRKL